MADLDPTTSPPLVTEALVPPDSIRGPFHPGLRRALRWVTMGLLLAWGVTMLWIGTVGINRDLEQDEAYIAWLDRPGWAHFWQYIPLEPSAPLYHYLMIPWFQIGGDSATWMRLPSSLCWVVSFPIIWGLGSYVLRRSERIAVFVLLIACREVTYDAVYARYFELMYLEMCVVLFCFIGVVTERMPRVWAVPLLALGNFAGIMTHYFFAYCLLAQGLLFLGLFRGRRLGTFVLDAVAPTLLFALLWLPTLRAQLASGRFKGQYSAPPVSFLVRDVYFGKRWLVIAPLVLALIVITHYRSRWRLASRSQIREWFVRAATDRRLWMFVTFWICQTVGPFLTAMVLGRRFLQPAPVDLLATLPFACLIATLIGRAERVALLGGGLVIVAIIAASNVQSRLTMAHQIRREGGSRASLDKIIAPDRTGDILIATDYYYTIVDYYLRRDHPTSQAHLGGFPADLESHPGYSIPTAVEDEATFNPMADEFVARVVRQAEAQPGTRVWVYDSEWIPGITRQLTQRFEKAMVPLDPVLVPRGEGYKTIFGFTARPKLAGL